MASRVSAAAFARIAPAVRQLLPLEGIAPPPSAISPVTAWRWDGSAIPLVHLGDCWAALTSVNGVPARDLVAAAVRLGRRDWQRLLVAEFPAVAAAAGAEHGAGAERGAGAEHGDEYLICRAGVADQLARATPERLVSSVWHYLTGDAPDPGAALAELAHPEPPAGQVSAAQVHQDLRVLEHLLAREFAYWDQVPRDWGERLARMRAEAAPTDRTAHVEAMRDLMVLLGDGHTRVDPGDADLLRRGVLPFQIDWIGDAPVAVRADRSALLDPDHPFIAAIAGRPVRDWIDAARPAVPRGTRAMRRNWLARELRRAGALAARLEAPVESGGEAGRIDLTLADATGARRASRIVDLRSSDPKPDLPMVGSRWLPGGTGYLALRGKMTADPDAIGQVHAAMRGFAPARALVIDIRDNPGGSRDLLRAVIGYLLAPGAAVVTSWARLRRAPGTDPEDVAQLLEGRFMRPWNWPGWSPPARAAAESFAARHAPEWPAPDDARFGPLNLMIAERLPEHGTLHLDCPVALLTNIRNYSAADIFAAALAVLPQVTLLGTPTAGGSGFARRTVLPGSRLAIQISTMASGMISGDLFENRGVLPDEIVAPTLAQWREPLEGDPLILRALRRLAERPDRNDTQQTRHRECIG